MVRGAKQFLDSNKEIPRLIPGPLRKAFFERLARLSTLLEFLVASTEEDIRIIATALELLDIARPQVLGAFSRNETSAISAIPTDGDSSSSPSSQLPSLLANEDTRNSIREKITALGRRVGAS